MGWFFGGRREPKPQAVPASETGLLVGLEVNASWVRGALLGADGSLRQLRIAGESLLPQAISLEKRKPEVGQAGLALCCRAPHLCCLGFFPLLGQSREWRVGRHLYQPDTAQKLVLIKVHPHVAGREGLTLCLPIYLSLAQTNRFIQQVESLDWPLRITTPTPLALAELLFESSLASLPDRPTNLEPLLAIIVDVDDYALSACLVQYTGSHVQLLRDMHFVLTDLGTRIWKDRIIDGMADYCIQQSNFDPRESGQTEQMLFDQTEEVLRRWQAGELSSVAVLGQGWEQRLDFRPGDLEWLCQPLAAKAALAVQGLLGRTRSAALTAVWLTDSASRLPGLLQAIKRVVPAQTSVQQLPVDAVGHAGARLAMRWKQGNLTGGLYDSNLPTLSKAGSRIGQLEPPIYRQPEPVAESPGRRAAQPRGATSKAAPDQRATLPPHGTPEPPPAAPPSGWPHAPVDPYPDPDAVPTVAPSNQPPVTVEPADQQPAPTIAPGGLPPAPLSKKKPLVPPPETKRPTEPPVAPAATPTPPPPPPPPPAANKPVPPKPVPERPTPPKPPQRPRISLDD